MGYKGSRHRVGSYAAYQNNLPHSRVKEGDTVTCGGGDTGIAVKKNYLTSEWLVRFPEGVTELIHEIKLTNGGQPNPS